MANLRSQVARGATDYRHSSLKSAVRSALVASGALVFSIGVSGVAYSQAADEDKNKEKSKTTLEEIVVTGSRIQVSGFDAPNPVTVVDSQMIEDLGLTNIGEAVSQLPMDNPQVSAVNTSVGSINDYVTGSNIGAQLANLRGLNPFFGTRTLTLVDGHRFVPSTNGGSVDLGLIPSNLVARTEVVTGGASAAYGSDAVAGVVNVVLDHEMKGFKIQTDYSETERGDGESFHVAVAGGMSLFGGKGHLIAGGEFDDAKGIGSCTDTRSWCKPYAIFNTPQAFEAQYPDYYLTNDARAVVTGAASILTTTGVQPATQTGTTNAAFTADAAYASVPPELQNRQFNDAGSALATWQTGQFYSPANRVMVGGDGLPQDFGTQLRVPVERRSFYTRMQYDLTDQMTGFVEASYGQRKTDREQRGLQYSILGTTTSGALIKWDNAFLPASVRALLDRNGDGVIAPMFTFTPGPGGTLQRVPTNTLERDGIYIGKANTTFPPPIQHSKNETYRGVIGVDGAFLETFKWDSYYTYGKNKQAQSLENARRDGRGTTNSAVMGMPRLTGACQTAAQNGTMNSALAVTCGVNEWTISPFDFAIDAVLDNETVITPGTGSIVCRATLNGSAVIRGLANGCVPLNLLGTSNASATALAYAFGTEYEDYEYTQNAFGANIQGQPIEGWAGPIAVAVGVEYRDDESATTHRTPQNYWAPDFGGDFAGKTEVLEGYLETQFLLLKDVPMVKTLDFNGAYRRTRNESAVAAASKTFNINTWKLNLQWAPVDWLKFRTTRSRDVRAPSFRELFFPGRDTPSFPVTNPWTGVTDTTDILKNGGGNYDLRPEEANTWTLGFVFQPEWGWSKGMRLSVDAYDIKLTDGIANVSTGGITAACQSSGGTDPLCDKITGIGNPVSGFTDIETITSGSLNAEAFRTRGIDFEIAYRLALAEIAPALNGNLNFRVLSSWLKELTLESSKRNAPTAAAGMQGAIGTNYSGQVGSGGVDDTASFSEAPKWQFNATLGYSLGGFRTTLQAKYVGHAQLYVDLIGPDDPRYTPAFVADASTAGNNSINQNKVGSYTTFNLSSSYEFDWGPINSIEFFGVIRNLFDREPVIAPPIPPGGGYTPTNAVFYDMIGRTFQVGARLKF